jgi:hypothetical protein
VPESNRAQQSDQLCGHASSTRKLQNDASWRTINNFGRGITEEYLHVSESRTLSGPSCEAASWSPLSRLALDEGAARDDRKTGNSRAVQLLLDHNKLESTAISGSRSTMRSHLGTGRALSETAAAALPSPRCDPEACFAMPDRRRSSLAAC